jgi:hypothetical protein
MPTGTNNKEKRDISYHVTLRRIEGPSNIMHDAAHTQVTSRFFLQHSTKDIIYEKIIWLVQGSRREKEKER